MTDDLNTVLYETAKDLNEAGLLDTKTMREFDVLSLPKVKKLSPRQIKKLRIANKASQAVFAAHLNTNLSTIQKWEQGKKSPNGLSLKLLNLIDKFGLRLLAV